MSLRWIYENLEPPNCEEECSDIDDSCSSGEDSDDSNLVPVIGPDHHPPAINNNNNNNNNNAPESRRRHATSTTGVTTAATNNDKKNSARKTEKRVRILAPCVEWEPAEVIIGQSTPAPSVKLKLFCRSGYYIGITSTGRAKGFPAASTNDAYVRFVVCPVSCGVIRLQSVETGHYLAFNSTGHLYGEKNLNKDSTEWEQWKIGDYDAFRSRKYAEQSWWLGIKRNGRHKPGPRTAWGQKSTQFLPIRLTD